VDASVVVPVFNEAENVDACYQAVTDVLRESGLSYEIIFVDDGSTDGSSDALRRLSGSDDHVQLIRLARNAGQQRALAVGLRYACGRAVVTFDADLQYDPHCLVEFTKEVLSGTELVSGVRFRRSDSWMMWWPSILGNALINRFLKVKQQDFGSVKAYSRELVTAILEREHQTLCIPAMAWVIAESTAEISVTHLPRQRGRSKWTVLQRAQLFLDVIAAYGRRPFQWLSVLGLLCVSAGFVLALGLLVFRVAEPHRVISGTIIFFDLFVILTGVNFIVLAYIGEFVIRGYRESLGRMSARVSEVRRHDPRPRAPGDAP
jgi:glycosyltransferase involved in cell wall biosynthesis